MRRAHGRAGLRTWFLWAPVLALTAGALGGSGAVSSRAPADDRKTTIVAGGLDNPRGLGVAPDGSVYVAEAGTGGTTAATCAGPPPPIGPFTGGLTARVSRVPAGGTRTTIASGLPSAQTAVASGNEVLGAEEVVFVNGVPYVLTQGGGCAKGNPTFNNGIYRINPGGTLTQIADLTAWFSSHPTAGPQDDDRDPQGVPTSMLFANGAFYVLEGNNAPLIEVTLAGQIRRVADLSVAVGQKTFTALEYAPDGSFYVGTFGEAPYPDGSAALYRVTSAGQVSLVTGGLTTVIDMTFDCRGRLYILESSTGNTPSPPFLTAASGRVREWNGSGFKVAVEGLSFATDIAFAPDGDLYISNIGYAQGPAGGRGQLLKAKVGSPPAAACR